MRIVAYLVGLLCIVAPRVAVAEQPTQPQAEDPATTIANVMAGLAFATRCGTITVAEAGEAGRLIMIFGQRHGIDPTKSGEIATAAIAATAHLPDYTFTDSLCSLYATGIHNLISRFDK
jgi:hypothetical protein